MRVKARLINGGSGSVSGMAATVIFCRSSIWEAEMPCAISAHDAFQNTFGVAVMSATLLGATKVGFLFVCFSWRGDVYV